MKSKLLPFFILLISSQVITSCASKSEPERTLAGKWKITSALGNNDRHWTGSLMLKKSGDDYTGVFLWESLDDVQSGTDSVSGRYNVEAQVLTLKSITITGNIEPVTYTADVDDSQTKISGIWTGSSDGSVEDPGVWTAEKE